MLWRPDDGRPTRTSPAATAPSVEEVGALDDPTQVAARSRSSGPITPGARRFAAEERAARQAAAGRHPGHDVATSSGPPADSHVVEEEERLRARTGDVVRAHRHEVDPQAPEAPRPPPQGHLGPDAVRGGHEDRAAEAGGDLDRPGESPPAADHLGADRRSDGLAHEGHRPFARLHVDAGRTVRVAGGGRLGAGRLSHGPAVPPRGRACGGPRRTGRAPGSGRRSRRSRTPRRAARGPAGGRGWRGSRGCRRR